MKLNEFTKLIRKEIIGLLKEKAVSKAQQRAAGIALAAKQGDIPKSKLKGPAKSMGKMSKKDLEDFMTNSTLNTVFSDEFKGLAIRKKNKTPEEIRDRLIKVFMGETQLGETPDNPGGAVGLLQVEPDTFKDVVKQGQFGLKAAKESGLAQADLNIIKNTSDIKVLTKYLEKPKVNYMAAAARIFQYLKHHNL